MRSWCVPALLLIWTGMDPALRAADPLPLSVVSAASYKTPVAAGSTAAAFGRLLAVSPLSATSLPLPTRLGTTTVMVKDAAGNTRAAPIYYASPSQVNFVLPRETATGDATVTIESVVGRSETAVAVNAAAPGLFSASASGAGVAAGFGVTASSRRLAAECQAGSCIPASFTPADLVLELYGTGWRNASNVAAIVDGIPATVLFSGPQGQYEGLDQINLRVPSGVRPGNLAEIVVTADGMSSNRVTILFGAGAGESTPRALFSLSSPQTGPFPSNAYLAPDPTERSGFRVNLPLPDCNLEPSTCSELAAVNQLDGFNVQPRLQARFTTAVDPASLAGGLWLYVPASGKRMKLNRLVLDPLTNTVYGEPDEPTGPAAKYLFVVTNAVKTAAGQSFEADPAYRQCVGNAPQGYCADLNAAVIAAQGAIGQPVISASVFTTMSSTSWLERARDALNSTPPAFQRTGNRPVFDLFSIAQIKVSLQNRTSPAAFSDFNVSLPSTIVPGAGRIAFGSFSSPNYLDERGIIPGSPTVTGTLSPGGGVQSISFHAVLPSSQKPAAGYPVVIFGHGLNDSSFGAPTLVAGAFARAGLATFSLNAAGHGNGPLSRVVVTEFTGRQTEFPSGGRGKDLNQDGAIDSREGCVVTTPLPLALRDCLRQTAVDILQAVRAIRMGMDLDGDGTPDLDPARVYFAGQSMGALYGTLVTALEPTLQASALNVGGASVVNIAEFSESFEGLTRQFLTARNPPVPPDGNFQGVFPLRNAPVLIADRPGVIAAQDTFERMEWLQSAGDPLPYARSLVSRPVLFQFARGDRTVPNPATANLIRQAQGQERSVVYRHDLAAPRIGGLSENPHAFLVDIRNPSGLAIALAAQDQIAGFLLSGGATLPDANNAAIRLLTGVNVFENRPALPEDLGY